MIRSVAIQISLALSLAVIPLWAAVITTMPASTSAVPGDLVSVVVGVSGIAGTDVGVFDLNVNFNPLVLAYDSVAFGDPVLGDELDLYGYGSATNVDASNAAAGTVDVSETAFDSAQDLQSYQPPAFGLFTITFDAVGGGSTSVSSTVNALGDGAGNNLRYSYGPPAIVDVAVLTPEPSTLALFAGGLGILLFVARRRAKYCD